jgi:hypothetical protein
VPELIDLSMALTRDNGSILTGRIVAASPGISITDLTPNNAYRINGCTIGAPGDCTPLNEKVVEVPLENLIPEQLVRAEEPPLLNDPTITGAGNEEIWRFADPIQEEEEEEEEE